jgi:hypothetical protein
MYAGATRANGDWDLPDPVCRRVASRDEIVAGPSATPYVTWLDECAPGVRRARHTAQLCRELDRGMAVWRTQISYLALRSRGGASGSWRGRPNDGSCGSTASFQIRRVSDGEICCALIHYVCIELTSAFAIREPPSRRPCASRSTLLGAGT